MVKKFWKKKEATIAEPLSYDCKGTASDAWNIMEGDYDFSIAYIARNVKGLIKGKKDRAEYSKPMGGGEYSVIVCQEYDVEETPRKWAGSQCRVSRCEDSTFENCSESTDSPCNEWAVDVDPDGVVDDVVTKNLPTGWNKKNLLKAIEELKTPEIRESEVVRLLEDKMEYGFDDIYKYKGEWNIQLNDPMICGVYVASDGDKKSAKLTSRLQCHALHNIDEEVWNSDFIDQMKKNIETITSDRCKVVRGWRDRWGYAVSPTYSDEYEMEMECTGIETIADISTATKEAYALLRITDEFMAVVEGLQAGMRAESMEIE